MSVRADAETLRRIPLFADCDPVHLQVLAFAAERKHFAPGEKLITEGESGDSAYLVLSGRVEVRSSAVPHGELAGEAEPGALLGEVAMIGQVPYSITAIAASEVAAARIDRPLFLRVAEAYPEFGVTVFRAMARKLEASLKDLNGVRQLLDHARSFSRRM
jgi:CRP-like cAMP-binding protein